MKSIIYSVNTSSQSITGSGTISFGNAVIKSGCGINMASGSAVFRGSGLYDVDTNINFTSGGAGTTVVTLYKDGQPISGASSTITTESGSEYSVSIPCLIKTYCCVPSTVSAVLTGTATVSSASIKVAKQ